MRGAFVVQLAPESRPRENRLEGRVEEVDSGRGTRFHCAAELVRFLEERFRMAFEANAEGDQLSDCSSGARKV